MIKHLFIYATCISLFSISCNKDDSYTSISGIWTCEEINPIEGIRIYNVDIERRKSADSQFIINNFHNMGNNNFVFAIQDGDSLFIDRQSVFTESFDNGIGVIDSEKKRIELVYNNLNGANEIEVTAVYIRD